MRILIGAGVIALGVALGSAGGSAQIRMNQPATQQFAAEVSGNKGVESAPNVNRAAQQGAEDPGYSPDSGVYDGCNPHYLRDQQELLREPGYNIGTGCGRVGDGSDPDYLQTQKELQAEPGYNVGGGSAATSK